MPILLGLKGINIMIPNMQGKTPLWCAVMNKYTKIIDHIVGFMRKQGMNSVYIQDINSAFLNALSIMNEKESYEEVLYHMLDTIKELRICDLHPASTTVLELALQAKLPRLVELALQQQDISTPTESQAGPKTVIS